MVEEALIKGRRNNNQSLQNKQRTENPSAQRCPSQDFSNEKNKKPH